MNSNDIDESSVRRAAAAVDLDIAPAHLPGVLFYYRMVAGFAATVADFALDETSEPAGVFTPCPVKPKA
jgi:Protein of unknown function (DUF4089)